MKKACISFLMIAIIILTAVACKDTAQTTEYLRIHVRANSNLKSDQDVKMEIKDKVVEYLTPFIKNARSKEEAISAIESQKYNVKRFIDSFLFQKGFKYGSKVDVKKEEFPTRVYDDLILESGVYDAVIISLGEAKGDNWWCVVFPPLCFTEGEVEYRSVVVEIFNKFFRQKEE